MHWDFVATSFEPIDKVTGGIGTYTRLLLHELAGLSKKAKFNVLFLTRVPLDPDWRTELSFDRLRIVLLEDSRSYNGGSLNYVGDQHAYFSFQVADFLEQSYHAGDTFGLLEFSDFGRDGFFTIKKRRLGQFNCGKIAVRLHSPELMIFSDNRNPLLNMDKDTFYKFEQELYCYRHCDTILYGGSKMLERVESELRHFDLSIVEKAIQVAHPFMIPDTERLAARNNLQNTVSLRQQLQKNFSLNFFRMSRPYINILYVGRIERRKGIYDFFRLISTDAHICSIIKKYNIRFTMYGKDTNTGPNGSSLQSEIQKIIDASMLKDCATFKGYVSQIDLYGSVIPSADAFIFPSLFENYPNALIETLPYGKPTLISSRGCMEEIAHSFKFISTYDPLALDALDQIRNFLNYVINNHMSPISRQRKNEQYQQESFQNYIAVAKNNNRALISTYQSLISTSQLNKDFEYRDLSVSFVIPHFCQKDFLENCILSIKSCMRDGDEIIVVDDCSGTSEVAHVVDLCSRYGAKLIELNVNGGPSAARNHGFEASNSQLIQFIDADDILDPKGFEKSLRAIEINDDLDFVYGIAHTFGNTDHLWMPRDVTLNALEENYTHSAILVRRSILEDVGGFNINLRHHYEDWEFNARLAILGKKGESIPCVTFYYRQKSGSRNISNADLAAQSRLDVISEAIGYCKINANVSGFVQKMGFYLENWIMTARRNEDRDRYIRELEDYKSKALFESSSIGPRTTIRVSRDFIGPNSTRNLRMHIYDKHFAAQFISTRDNIINRVSIMNERERVEFIKQSALFDADWYLEKYPDVKNARMDPHEHYDRHGWKEGRAPNAYLSSEEIDEALDSPKNIICEANKFIVFSLLVS